MNVYDVINSRILALLEQGTVPWRRGWNVQTSIPRSFATKKEYKGINYFLLSSMQYSQPWFMTFKQIQERGGHVKQGEKACPIVFWKWIESTDPDDKNKVPLLRYYNVFSVEQTEGITYQELVTSTNQEFTPIQKAEEIITNMPNKPLIQHLGNKATYNIRTDTVTLPPKQNFESPEEYYSTAYHELTHATMAEHRLNRKANIQVHQWGDVVYSKEELVAEMGAAFLCGHAGIQQTLENSAAYLAGWLKALKNDKTLLVHAAAAAQKASDYILNKSLQEDPTE